MLKVLSMGPGHYQGSGCWGWEDSSFQTHPQIGIAWGASRKTTDVCLTPESVISLVQLVAGTGALERTQVSLTCRGGGSHCVGGKAGSEFQADTETQASALGPQSLAFPPEE